MTQVNMPEKKDSMAQGMQVFQAVKSVYDMKKGGAPSGGDPSSSTAGNATSASTTPMQRRYVAGKANP